MKNNVFDRCLGRMLRYNDYSGYPVVFEDNVYVQYYGETFVNLSGTSYPFDGSALEVMDMIGDTSAKLACVLELKPAE